MSIREIDIDFLISALNVTDCNHTIEEIFKWIDNQREKIRVNIEPVSFSELENWEFEKETLNMVHKSGKFFSIEGINVRTNWRNKNEWEQPIINQPEIGYLGIITKKMNGILHFLMQAKIEPGNINFVQISPTLQATKSNYTRVHKGKQPLYLEYFNGTANIKTRILLDQLQSEQGARFLRKRNRNIIIEVEEDIPIHDNFMWMTLGQLKQLLMYDNLVNMDTRTVISGISYGVYPKGTIDFYEFVNKAMNQAEETNKSFLISAVEQTKSCYSFEEIISWITNLKSEYDLNVTKIPLGQLNDWIINEKEIHHKDRKYFSIIGARIEIGNREVTSWCQPIVKSAQEGIIAFIVKKINNVYHFLVQAKVEAGNFDILEIAPTVQCLTGNYRKGLNEYEVPFLDYVLSAEKERILHKSLQSEEGGRFFKEQNLNIIIKADDDFTTELPENYIWMTLNQMLTLIKFNNYLNIQARSLLSVIKFN